jgi:hypothetical protein
MLSPDASKFLSASETVSIDSAFIASRLYTATVVVERITQRNWLDGDFESSPNTVQS